MTKRLIWPICGYKRITTVFGRNATPVATPKENRLARSLYLIVLYGAGTKSRTRDLLITNQLLYQLSYAGMVSHAGSAAAELFSFRGCVTRALNTLSRTSRSISQQYAILAVFLDDGTSTPARWQPDIHEIHGTLPGSRRYLGWQV